MTTPPTLNFEEKEGPATHSAGEKPFDDVAFTFQAHWQPHCQVLSLLPARDLSKGKAATNLIDKLSSSHRTSARKPLALCQSRFTVPSASCSDPRDKEDLSDEGLSADAPGEEARPQDLILAVFVVSVVGPSPLADGALNGPDPTTKKSCRPPGQLERSKVPITA
ncbi:hypothetical protein E4U57_001696 [Claviceps arundinis]|uniref:Uncharacterized protein n=1 Tax=Claviceps arundinis TaxID=1623583 RepID=A0ABQ7PC02_9HYPO|nr:hypothetical protein E4U57_001696 [Claviceps arundinis]